MGENIEGQARTAMTHAAKSISQLEWKAWIENPAHVVFYGNDRRDIFCWGTEVKIDDEKVYVRGQQTYPDDQRIVRGIGFLNRDTGSLGETCSPVQAYYGSNGRD